MHRGALRSVGVLVAEQDVKSYYRNRRDMHRKDENR